MLSNRFGFGLIRKYTAVFGTLFNDVFIERTSDDGTVDQLIRVPIEHASKDKMIAILSQDPDLNRPFSSLVPRMTYIMGDLQYAPGRKIITINKIEKQLDGSTRALQYSGVPYDIHFQLHIFGKNDLDGAKILEQILPFFTPDWTPRVNLIPEMGVIVNLPIILQNVSTEDTIFGDIKNTRNKVWTLDFVMQASFYGPVKKQGLIKFATVNTYDATLYDNISDAVGNATDLTSYSVQPGLTTSGQPTNDIHLTIPYQDIQATDNYGYVEEYRENILSGGVVEPIYAQENTSFAAFTLTATATVS